MAGVPGSTRRSCNEREGSDPDASVCEGAGLPAAIAVVGDTLPAGSMTQTEGPRMPCVVNQWIGAEPSYGHDMYHMERHAVLSAGSA